MKLPFTTEQFFEVIQRYNETVWPAQILLTALALGAVVLLFFRRPWSSRAIGSILALLWAWTGVAYHFAFFTRINPAAFAFGALFLVGAAAFVWFGVVRQTVRFAPARTTRGFVGLALVVYALVVYPLWSAASGHPYPTLPTFGLPCPTTLFTVGMLCLAAGKGHWVTLVPPVLWSLVGVQAAFLFEVIPDFALGVAALVALGLGASAFRAERRMANA
jgi:hypothetical protein